MDECTLGEISLTLAYRETTNPQQEIEFYKFFR